MHIIKRSSVFQKTVFSSVMHEVVFSGKHFFFPNHALWNEKLFSGKTANVNSGRSHVFSLFPRIRAHAYNISCFRAIFFFYSPLQLVLVCTREKQSYSKWLPATYICTIERRNSGIISRTSYSMHTVSRMPTKSSRQKPPKWRLTKNNDRLRWSPCHINPVNRHRYFRIVRCPSDPPCVRMVFFVSSRFRIFSWLYHICLFCRWRQSQQAYK